MPSVLRNHSLLRGLFLIGILLLVFSLLDHKSSAEIYGCFVGWKACIECHTTEGEGWQKTRHAAAFESLKKTQQQGLPDCIQCHVVGYDQYGGFLDEELTPELSGVQCENCHGYGKEHAQGNSKVLIAAPPKYLCQKCHTPLQDPNFHYEEKVRFVHGE